MPAMLDTKTRSVQASDEVLTQLRDVKARCDEEREQMLIQKEEDMLMSFGMLKCFQTIVS